MQRRAAAIYVAFFLVVGAVSFSLIATAGTPHFSIEDPEYTLTTNESFTIDGQQYTVTEISAEMSSGSSGGHGGGGAATLQRSGVIQWTNQSAVYTGEWSNGSTVTYDDTTWNVSIPATNNTTQFTLVEVVNRSAILANDSSVANQTTTVDGREYVVRTENGTRTLVNASEYFPEPETRQFEVGQTIDYEGNETTIASISDPVVALQWSAPETTEVNVADNSNVTISNSTYFAHFPDNSTMELTREYSQYQEFQNEETEFVKHTNGLWGVTILSFLSVIFLTGLAYMPSRY